ncbi:MAG: purine-nucleoside phosphorylase [Spirochaetales bacterium]|nr:purine-nucleoside phosphorylase [Spirochaetales bacterium]
MSKYTEAADFIKSRIKDLPKTGLILGSGLNDLADAVENPVILPYGEIPHFPSSTAPGHKGRLVLGKLEGKDVIVMQGRFHYYEGYPMDTLVLPVRVMKLLGVERLIVTNAAGGVNTDFTPGDLMIIEDHIKMGGGHPLIGPNDSDFGPRFNDMSQAYTRKLVKTAEEEGKALGLNLRKGVYTFMTGPSYETPAEIRMLRTLGADAVGMSTVPEVIAAAHAGLEVLGISCISNMAAGILDQPITEEEVIEAGQMVKEKFTALLKAILTKIG